jgi:signal transduction histidine kinase
MRHGRRRLQARLLLWFIGAILLAVGASMLTTWLTNDQNSNDNPSRVVSRHVQQRVAKLWDDPAACDAYIAQLRDNTGLDIRVRRDPHFFDGQRRRGPNQGMIFEDGVAYLPVVQKHGMIVGALEVHTGAPAPKPWRVVLALLAALLALSLAARRVAVRLSRPLEHVAAAAERFGAGDLTARAGIDKFGPRWVADEVRDLGRSFDVMAERISRIVLEQRELLAAISHELRSPLGRARVALEIARDRSAEPVTAHDDIERQLGEVDAILGDLLASARAGLADLRKQPTDIDQWVKDRVATETTGPVSVKARSAVKAEIDPALLGRALHNLLANAWAHGHPKEVPLEVSVAPAEESGFVRVAVRDHGPGFSAEILPRAFDAFVTGTGAARSPGAHGMGLGLALVRRIVEAHGGRVSAVNVEEAGKSAGAIVGIELPVLAAA